MIVHLHRVGTGESDISCPLINCVGLRMRIQCSIRGISIKTVQQSGVYIHTYVFPTIKLEQHFVSDCPIREHTYVLPRKHEVKVSTYCATTNLSDGMMRYQRCDFDQLRLSTSATQNKAECSRVSGFIAWSSLNTSPSPPCR